MSETSHRDARSIEGNVRAETDTMVSEGVLYAEPAGDEMKA